jgi:hypothetical protein
VRELVKNEGAGAFFKGLTPKVRSRCLPPTRMSCVNGCRVADPGGGPEARLQLHARAVAYPALRHVRLGGRHHPSPSTATPPHPRNPSNNPHSPRPHSCSCPAMICSG